MTTRIKWQDRLRTGHEQDFLTGWCRWLITRPGQRKYVKRKWNRRVRQIGKKLARDWRQYYE